MVFVCAVLSLVFAMVPHVAHRAVGVRAKMRPARSMVGAVLIFFVLLAWREAFGPAWAIAAGTAACTAMALVSVKRARRFARIEQHCRDFATDRAKEAILAIDQELRGWWSIPSEGRPFLAVTWTLHIVERAMFAGHVDQAFDWLSRIPRGLLTPDLQAIYTQYRTAALLRRGDREGARRALLEAPRNVRSKEFDQALRALESLVDAIEGDASAEARADAALAEGGATPRVQPVWRAVRAHALASRGAEPELESLFAEIRAGDGEEALRRIVTHAGPASRRAESFLAKSGPYR